MLVNSTIAIPRAKGHQGRAGTAGIGSIPVISRNSEESLECEIDCAAPDWAIEANPSKIPGRISTFGIAHNHSMQAEQE
jgi:hypothetical protein